MIATLDEGAGTPVLCLHGWPGASSDYRGLLPFIARDARVVIPDLRGFGASFAPGDVERPATDFGRDAQVDAVCELLDGLELPPAVVVGFDVGGFVAQALARRDPGRVRALVLGNVLHPGTLSAVLDDEHRAEFWYQDFHRLVLAGRLVDGSPAAVRTYLEHFWSHWGARPVAEVTDELVEAYARPGAFTTSLNWYRSGSATLALALASRGAADPPPIDVPTTVLWGARDPLYPPRLATGLERTFTALRGVHVLDDVGHFVPLEAPEETASAVRALL